VSIYGDQQLQALDGFQFDLSKMMEYDEAEEERKFIEQRNKEIQMLLLELEELRDIFADQADMMVQQGELLETVSRQTEAAELATRQAVVELAKVCLLFFLSFFLALPFFVLQFQAPYLSLWNSKGTKH
jgi:hypothetical protein